MKKLFLLLCVMQTAGSLLFPTVVRAQLTVQQVADLNPGSNGSFPSNTAVFGNALVFSAYTAATGREPWKYDGKAISLVSNIDDTTTVLAPGVVVGNDSNPYGFTAFNKSLYFTAFEPRRGGELWVWNGTNAAKAADINPDPNDTIKANPASSWPSELTVFGNHLYFSATSGQTPNYELWKFDGLTASLAANIHPDTGSDYSSYPKGLTVFNGALYFQADDGTNGYQLWKYDSSGARLFTINPGGEANSAYPKFFTPFGGWLYFQAFHALYGYELWRTDGTNVSLVTDLNPGPADSFPDHLTVFNGSLYFSADDGVNGVELWKYDGVSTSLVTNINPFGSSSPKNLTVFGNQLVFAADDGVHGWELWQYDGVSASLVTDLNPVGDSFPEWLTVFGKALYFVATTPDTGYEIWRYDGTNVTLASDINPGPGSSYPMNLTVFSNQLCFSATADGVSNWELWTLTPVVTNSPPQPVALLAPVLVDGNFVFSFASDSQHSYQVETSDSSGSGSWQVLTNLPGTGALLTVTNSIPAAGQGFYRVQTQ